MHHASRKREGDGSTISLTHDKLFDELASGSNFIYFLFLMIVKGITSSICSLPELHGERLRKIFERQLGSHSGPVCFFVT